MLSSRIAVVALAVFGLGGAGVVAASSAGVHVAPNDQSHASKVVQTARGNEDRQGSQDDGDSIDLATGSFTPTWTVSSTDDLSETGILSGANKVAIDISKFYSVPVTYVVDLHASGWGFGEIQKLFSYALQSGKTVSDVLALRDSGMGWGNIAKELGLKPGNGGNNLGGIISGRLQPSGTVTLTQTSGMPSVAQKHVQTNGNSTVRPNGNRRNVVRPNAGSGDDVESTSGPGNSGNSNKGGGRANKP